MNVRPYKTEQTALLIRKQQLDIPRKDAVTNFKVMIPGTRHHLYE